MSGRPRKYEGPVKRFEAWIPYEVYKEMEAVKQQLGASWSELVQSMWEVYRASRK